MIEFYTYLWLRENGSPWYVGKGTGNRAYKSHEGHRPPKDHSLIKIQHWPDEATAFSYEIYQIDFWGRIDLGTGILRNRTDGGDGPSGAKASEETRKKMSKVRKGVPKSEETRKRMSEAQKGRVNSESTRKKISDSKKGKHLSEEIKSRMSNTRKGRQHSLETRKRMSEAAGKRWKKCREKKLLNPMNDRPI